MYEMYNAKVSWESMAKKAVVLPMLIRLRRTTIKSLPHCGGPVAGNKAVLSITSILCL